VHGLASAQSVSTVQVRQPGIGVCVQPSVASQASVVQALASSQLGGAPVVQVPLWHVSVPLQGFVSPHGVPFGSVVCPQPVTASQVSVVHAFPSLQLSGVPAVHTPAWHVSAPLHTVASAHDVPLATGECWQPATASQPSVVHGFPSLQLRGVPAAHTPAWHVSAPLHTVASAHEVPLATAVF